MFLGLMPNLAPQPARRHRHKIGVLAPAARAGFQEASEPLGSCWCSGITASVISAVSITGPRPVSRAVGLSIIPPGARPRAVSYQPARILLRR